MLSSYIPENSWLASERELGLRFISKPPLFTSFSKPEKTQSKPRYAAFLYPGFMHASTPNSLLFYFSSINREIHESWG